VGGVPVQAQLLGIERRSLPQQHFCVLVLAGL